MIQSVAVHRADCQSLELPVQFAATSNCLARDAGLKSDKYFRKHRLLHQGANEVKHDGTDGEFEVFPFAAPPRAIQLVVPPPPPLPNADPAMRAGFLLLWELDVVVAPSTMPPPAGVTPVDIMHSDFEAGLFAAAAFACTGQHLAFQCLCSCFRTAA